jgi:hypothetical protein
VLLPPFFIYDTGASKHKPIFTYETWPIPSPGRVSTSLAAPGRRIGQRTNRIGPVPSHFSKTPLTFSNIKLRRTTKRTTASRLSSKRLPLHLKLVGGKLEDASRLRRGHRGLRSDPTLLALMAFLIPFLLLLHPPVPTRCCASVGKPAPDASNSPVVCECCSPFLSWRRASAPAPPT